jgi:hypothetical protein
VPYHGDHGYITIVLSSQPSTSGSSCWNSVISQVYVCSTGPGYTNDCDAWVNSNNAHQGYSYTEAGLSTLAQNLGQAALWKKLIGVNYRSSNFMSAISTIVFNQ